jgi:hypothetical protein
MRASDPSNRIGRLRGVGASARPEKEGRRSRDGLAAEAVHFTGDLGLGGLCAVDVPGVKHEADAQPARGNMGQKKPPPAAVAQRTTRKPLTRT